MTDLICVFGGGSYRPIYGPVDFTGEHFISPPMVLLALVAYLVVKIVGRYNTLDPPSELTLRNGHQWRWPEARDVLLQEKECETTARHCESIRPPFASNDLPMLWKTAYLVIVLALVLACLSLM